MQIAVCIIVKNEEDYILEWMTHYGNIGFQNLIIFDNYSEDSTAQQVSKYVGKAAYKLIKWDVDIGNKQVAAYNYCLKEFHNQFDWIAFLDIDEMLVSKTGSFDFQATLSTFDDVNGIIINWVNYGSSGLLNKGNMLMMEAFTTRGPIRSGPNRNVKSIIRPEAVIGPCNNPHWFPIKGRYLNLQGEDVVWDAKQKGIVDISAIIDGEWHLNHYYTRGFDDWQKRVKRGQMGGRIIPERAFQDNDRNEIKDEIARTYSTKVREVWSTWGSQTASPQARPHY